LFLDAFRLLGHYVTWVLRRLPFDEKDMTFLIGDRVGRYSFRDPEELVLSDWGKTVRALKILDTQLSLLYIQLTPKPVLMNPLSACRLLWMRLGLETRIGLKN
jgi:hypothetical protein